MQRVVDYLKTLHPDEFLAVYDAIENGTYDDTESLEDFLTENNIEWV